MFKTGFGKLYEQYRVLFHSSRAGKRFGVISTIMRPSTAMGGLLISWPGPEKVFLGLHITEKLVFLCVCGLAYGGEIGFLGSARSCDPEQRPRRHYSSGKWGKLK